MKILITGDKGFVGSATRKLIEAKHLVVGYDLMDGYDIRDINQLNGVVEKEKPDRILHLAAIARFADADSDPMLAFRTNAGGTKNVAKVAAAHHIPLVYASTGSVYMPIEQKPPITEAFQVRGNSIYGCTKAVGEFFVKEHTPHIILRYAHLYGAEKRGHGLVGAFVQRIQRGMVPTLYGGRQSNDFTYIKDIAAANLLALEAGWECWNHAYNIGTGEELTSAHAAKIICDALGYEWEKVMLKDQRTVDPDRFVFDISKAKRMLGYEPKYDFETGIKDMLGMEVLKKEA